MTDSTPHDPPSAFVERWVRRLAPGDTAPRRALNVAAGKGRHAVVLATAGFDVFAIDGQLEALRVAAARVHAVHARLRAVCADLTMSRLPPSRFDLVVVTRYLQRDLFPDLIASLRPGGVLLYETFTEAQRARGRGPTSPDHLLRAGELPTHVRAMDVVSYEEVDDGVDAVAQLVARLGSSEPTLVR